MTTQTLYQKTLNEQMTPAEFLWYVRRDPQYNSIVTNTMSYEDTVNCLKSKGYIWDSKKEENTIKPFDLIGTIRSLNEGTTKKQKLKGGKGDKLTPDQVNYYEFKKGWKCELEHTDDIDKAKEIALDHLAEDPMYYTRLEMIEVKAKKKERADLPIDISKKKADVKDAKNQMSPVEKKKVSSNVSDSGKQEKARSKNAGVKKMKGGSGELKQIKESLLSILEEDEGPKGKFNAVFTIASPEEGKSINVDITYDRYKRMYLGNMKTSKYSKITPKDDTAKEFQKRIKAELKEKDKPEETSSEPIDTTGRGKFKIKDINGNEKELSISFDHYQALLRVRSRSKEEGEKYAEIIPLDKKAKDFTKEAPIPAINLQKSGAKEPKELAPSSQEKTISSDEYPYYIYNKQTKKLRGYDSRQEASEILEADPLENKMSRTLPEKYADPSKEYYVLNPKNVEKTEEGSYYTIESSHDTVEQAEKAASDLNTKTKSNAYIAISKKDAIKAGYYNPRIYLVVLDLFSKIVNMKPEDYKKQFKEMKAHPKDWLKKQGPLGVKISELIFKPRQAFFQLLREKKLETLKVVSNAVAKELVKSNLASYEKEPDEKKEEGKKQAYVVMNIQSGLKFSLHKTKEEADKEAEKLNKKENTSLYKVIKHDAVLPIDRERASKKDSESVDEKYNVLETYIRQKVRKYIAENIEGRYLGYAGPRVVKKKLEDYLKRYNPDWESDPSPEQKAVGSEYEDVIAKLVQELNGDVPELGTKIYKKYSDKPLDGAKANQVQLPSNISYDPTKLVSRGGRIAEDEIISKQEKKEKKKDKDEAGMGIGDRTIVSISTVEKDKTVPGPKKELLSNIQADKDKMQEKNPKVTKNELQQKLQTKYGEEIDSLYSKGAASLVVNYIINPQQETT